MSKDLFKEATFSQAAHPHSPNVVLRDYDRRHGRSVYTYGRRLSAQEKAWINAAPLDLGKAAPKVVEIVEVIPNHWDGDQGIAAKTDQYFRFRTNFHIRELPRWLKVIADNVFPAHSFGIGQEAWGYDEDYMRRWKLGRDSVAFYDHGYDDEAWQKLSRLLDEERKQRGGFF